MDDHNQPGASLWPLGFAIGIVVVLVGLVISLVISAIGAAIALAFGFAWVRGSGAKPETGFDDPEAEDEDEDEEEEDEDEDELMARKKFLGRATIALGGLIGAMVTLPVAGFAILPAFKRTRARPIDVGPITDFPEGQYVVTTFQLDPALGDIARRTAYIRNNGLLGGVPSFTIVSSRCTHVGCPTQPNGPVMTQQRKSFTSPTGGPVALTPSNPAGFGCPCHGSQFDNEGNRTAGPAARALDRYEFSVDKGRLVLGRTFSVSHVDDVGAHARIHRFALHGPGQPANGVESWLYPLQPPQ